MTPWSAEQPAMYDAVVVGAGFAGLYALHRMRGLGLETRVVSLEQHVEFVAGCIGWLLDRKLGRIEASLGAQDAWAQHVNAVAETTLYPRCNSWYLGANVPGKPRVFMPYIGFPPYVAKCEEVVAAGYDGFILAAAPAETQPA